MNFLKLRKKNAVNPKKKHYENTRIITPIRKAQKHFVAF